MKLKFVGKDGSMGLTHGNIYDVQITATHKNIWVFWDSNGCPYSSPQNLAKNWEALKGGAE